MSKIEITCLDTVINGYQVLENHGIAEINMIPCVKFLA